ncbi:hypothetical protein [Streptomyces olivochromogenes]|uniref:Uncharacterized protein n=1 Tax=Streptomyces olivochromogenes TaxID=1963 RepID=A0A250VBJ6_STROL|nr:hypothetical protein [Streptomyces olivochromogenes]KUN45531.1 hypothetical protein AQJ27_21630 [Streptomyces olivochromogenes]GAX51521.1 hypothetical protein SO3561_03023 [Streptomyces olivochromogenes]
MATYVETGQPGTYPTGTTTTLKKYVDWDPQGGGAGGPIFDTEFSATVNTKSRFTGAGQGVIYELTQSGELKSFKDNTATGGSLLTASKNYGTSGSWHYAAKIWADLDRIYVLDADHKLNVYAQSAPATGNGTLTLVGTVPAANAGVQAMTAAQDVWAVPTRTVGYRSTLYALIDGVIKHWSYNEGTVSPGGTTGLPILGSAATVDLTGLTGAVQAWSPGPGTIYTSDGAVNYSGTIAGYAGRPMALTNSEVSTGIYGTIFTDTASCLNSMEQGPPHFGTRPADGDVPSAEGEPAPDPDPTGVKVFKGRFTRGDGQPAAGLKVVVEAADVTPDDGTETDLPDLGTAVTADDGSWSLSLPDSLPPDVQAAADDNGGAVNAVATATGVTSSGVVMQGTDHLTAAPDSASAATRQLAAATESGTDPVQLLPQSEDDGTPQPTDDQYAQSWGSEQDRYTVDTLGSEPLPEWQSATSGLPTNFNPYVVGGVDTSSMPVSGTSVEPSIVYCVPYKQVIKTGIGWTTVVEGHAYWDAKASVDYDSKAASTVDAAVSVGSKWKIEGSVSVANSIGYATGYSNRGPHFAKQWQVPIEYKKIKSTTRCMGKTYVHYEIRAGRYKVPSGGAVGRYGKDVRAADGFSKWASSPTNRQAYVPAGSYFQLSKGHSVKFSGAVTAFGVKLGASSQYDHDHKQRITAGNSTAARHDIWGRNGPVWDNPGVFYSY